MMVGEIEFEFKKLRELNVGDYISPTVLDMFWNCPMKGVHYKNKVEFPKPDFFAVGDIVHAILAHPAYKESVPSAEAIQECVSQYMKYLGNTPLATLHPAMYWGSVHRYVHNVMVNYGLYLTDKRRLKFGSKNYKPEMELRYEHMYAVLDGFDESNLTFEEYKTNSPSWSKLHWESEDTQMLFISSLIFHKYGDIPRGYKITFNKYRSRNIQRAEAYYVRVYSYSPAMLQRMYEMSLSSHKRLKKIIKENVDEVERRPKCEACMYTKACWG